MDDAPQLTDSLDRARGPMLAAAIGDALGWPVENRSGRVGGVARIKPRLELVDWVRREGGGYAPHEVEVGAGSYSDDTQLTLAAGRSRLRGAAWWEHWTDCELPLWLLYERGGGGASKRAAQAWNRGRAPWSEDQKAADRDRYFSAGGNGVAMRIMPHVLLGATGEFESIASHILADGVCTHGHPRALVGALAYGYALWLALKQELPLVFGELVERTIDGEDQWGAIPEILPQISDWRRQIGTLRGQFENAWDETRDEMHGLLTLCRDSLGQGSLAVDRKALEELGAFDKKVNGAGTIAAAASVYLASRYASQPGQGLTAAAFAKGADTDTIAAMTGGLLGAIDHDAWLASLSTHLQDAAYIEEIAAVLGQDGFKTRQRGRSWRQSNRRELLDALVDGKVTIDMPVFGPSKVIQAHELPTKSSNSIKEWTLLTEEGQTLHVKRVAPDKSQKRTNNGQAALRPPFWLVLQVRDLRESERFYHDILGFSHRRDEGSERTYVADRIVLEPSAKSRPPSAEATDEKALLRRHEAITLFRSEQELKELHASLTSAENPVSGIFERGSFTVFRCTDPDGTVIEVRAAANPSSRTTLA
jgi:ADP-ribosylglycohydrolase/catechol 2,3-dioxygenase-like lactoylglutathione lyase family enzyme